MSWQPALASSAVVLSAGRRGKSSTVCSTHPLAPSDSLLLPFNSSRLPLLLLAWEVHRETPASLNSSHPRGDAAVGGGPCSLWGVLPGAGQPGRAPPVLRGTRQGLHRMQTPPEPELRREIREMPSRLWRLQVVRVGFFFPFNSCSCCGWVGAFPSEGLRPWAGILKAAESGSCSGGALQPSALTPKKQARKSLRDEPELTK